jgi:metallophosphoesterase superfamily enzyme
MTKIAMLCDTHSGIRNDSMVFHDYMKKNYDWFFSIINNQNIKTIVHLGDLFDRRKYVNYLTSKRIREDFLLQVEKRNLDCHIIAMILML